MQPEKKKYRFALINAFVLPKDSPYIDEHHAPIEGPKESRIMNFDNVKHVLEDVEWDFNPGALASYGNWPVLTREEFGLAAVARRRHLQIVYLKLGSLLAPPERRRTGLHKPL